jgi:hypothetical protein
MEWVWEVGIREYPPVPDEKPEAANVHLPASEVPMLLSDWLSGTGSNKSLMNQAMRPPMRVPTPYSKSNEVPGQLRVLTLAYLSNSAVPSDQ